MIVLLTLSVKLIVLTDIMLNILAILIVLVDIILTLSVKLIVLTDIMLNILSILIVLVDIILRGGFNNNKIHGIFHKHTFGTPPIQSHRAESDGLAPLL